MCYSALVEQRYQAYVRRFGAVIDIREFVRRYGMRNEDRRVKFPRALDLAFLADDDPALAPVRALIQAWDLAEAERLQRELFTQRRRVADAERALQTKVTRKAGEDVRIGSAKVEASRRRLADLRRTQPIERDARIFPGVDALVLTAEGDRLVLQPMRYQCRPAGKPATYDSRYPGTYNARRDNLEGFWKGQFGISHGLVLVEKFYENVERDGRNQVLEFVPDDGEPMLVACLTSLWQDPKGALPDLRSFAAITDEPPAEVAAAGHDRCIIPIKSEHLETWLNPKGRSLAELYAVLDDRHRPHYAHREAA